MRIKVSIVEDDQQIREGMAFLINSSETAECVSAYSTGEEALRQIPTVRPQVVLMDLNLPQMSGIDCTRKLKALLPEVQVLILTMYEDSEQVFNSIMAGASGYLVKRTPPAKILEAIQEIHTGASPMSGRIARMMVEHFRNLKRAAPELENLSKREAEVLELLAKGYRYKEIADALSVGFDTVRSHLRSIYDKLHVHSRTEAVAKYLQTTDR
ncbi:MAG TPA: response regulator transcription factor [Dongiaceae bacterium]|nr:response regulator transcription factor [Dongiaceae bacterium]